MHSSIVRVASAAAIVLGNANTDAASTVLFPAPGMFSVSILTPRSLINALAPTTV